MRELDQLNEIANASSNGMKLIHIQFFHIIKLINLSYLKAQTTYVITKEGTR